MKEKLIAGRYRVTGHLGQGGVGQVLKCLDEVLSNQVAVKILHTGAGESELVRFQKEAQTMAHLEHPNIVKVLDFGLSEGLPFLVMELCEADSLASWLETGELFDFESSYQIIHQIASALAYAHQQGVLHRDIKPSNVLLTYDSRGNLRTRICDFGLAKLKQDQQAQALTSDGAVIGSPAY
ncbi:MAG: serine/threonine protein kinase, partial [Candidatus Obscuribacterales bacterium]|nr:serine/threonine protein kinase [Candidatus Obscuribacterales bacterium]